MNQTKRWAALAASVIESSIKEREKAFQTLMRNPRNERARFIVEETDEFFGSEWFEILLELSGIVIDANEMRKRIDECKGISESGLLSEQADKGKGKEVGVAEDDCSRSYDKVRRRAERFWK